MCIRDRAGRVQLHPLGKKQEVRRQRDQERPEQRRQHVQVEIPQQIDDDQTARGVQMCIRDRGLSV